MKPIDSQSLSELLWMIGDVLCDSRWITVFPKVVEKPFQFWLRFSVSDYVVHNMHHRKTHLMLQAIRLFSLQSLKRHFSSIRYKGSRILLVNSLQLHYWTIIDQVIQITKIKVIQPTQDFNIHLFKLLVSFFPTDEAHNRYFRHFHGNGVERDAPRKRRCWRFRQRSKWRCWRFRWSVMEESVKIV